MIRNSKSKRTSDVILGFSPWILAAACGLLLLLLSLFTVSNYQREKDLIMEALIQKGLTLMRFINSSARESVRGNLRSNQEWVHWEEHVQTAILQAVEQPGVEFIMIVDASGNLLAGGGEKLPSQKIDFSTRQFIRNLDVQPADHFVTRVVDTEEHGRAFQIASRYLPPTDPAMMPPQLPGYGGRRRQMMSRFSNHPHYADIQQEMSRLAEQKPLYIVQLNLKQFNSPLRRQLLQTVLLLVVTMLVGAGGALSFMTLRGLRGSQLRLGAMRAFTGNLITSLPIGIIATDSEGQIQIFNDSAREILGAGSNVEYLGKLPNATLPPELARSFKGGFDEHDPQPAQVEIALDLEKGTRILQMGALAVINDAGEFAGETLLIRDLTEIRQLEKELQRSERLAALGKMAAGVAHELRNPLSSIKGLAVLLKKGAMTSGSDTETADVLVREVERLNRSIGELLDYAKPGQLKTRKVALPELIEKTVSLIKMDAESYGIDIVVDIDSEIPMVSVDKDKLNQVLLNLLLNSIQAMPGGGKLMVKVRNIRGEKISVAISDNGQGIDPENLTRVFDPYFTTKPNGTGLGLAMSAKIVEEHGGEIVLTSQPGECTTAEIILPIEQV